MAGPRQTNSPAPMAASPMKRANAQPRTCGGRMDQAGALFVIGELMSLSWLQIISPHRPFPDRQMDQRGEHAKRHRNPPHHIIGLCGVKNQPC